MNVYDPRRGYRDYDTRIRTVDSASTCIPLQEGRIQYRIPKNSKGKLRPQVGYLPEGDCNIDAFTTEMEPEKWYLTLAGRIRDTNGIAIWHVQTLSYDIISNHFPNSTGKQFSTQE